MRRKLNFAAVGVFSGLITFYSVYQPGPTISGYAGLSSIGHFLGYFGLSALLLLHFHPTKHGIMESIVLASAIGLVVELIQLKLPYRSFSTLDIVFNTLGASLVIFDYHGFATDKIVALEDEALRYISSLRRIVKS